MSLFTSYRASSASQAGVYERSSQMFPSPWLDPASAELPTDIEQVFRFCELLWYANPTYSQALNRIAAYFVTKVEISDVGSEEQERWDEFLNDKFYINKRVVEYGRNFLGYGNLMLSPRVAINRALRCDCGQFAPIAQWGDHWEFRAGRFTTGSRGCPSCRRSRPLHMHDFRPLSQDAVNIRVWNPHTMRIKYNSITERMVYRHILPREDAEAIRRGDRDFLEDTPWEFVQAATERCPIRLHNDQVFHLKDTPLAGIDSRGLGVPRAMASFRQAFLQQILQRLNMVLGMEYSTPLRSLTPEPSASGNMDITMGADLASVQTKLAALLADWKRDPAAIHLFPVPVRYTAWGGEGLQLASHEISRQTMEQLLTGLGVPVDFFVGSFKSERTFVPTLRLMERSWEELVSGYNAILDWIGETLSGLLRWRKPKLRMQPTTTADDLELRQILMDLYMNGRISGRTAMKPLRLDPVEENKQMLLENKEMQEDADTTKAQQDQETSTLQGVSTMFGAGQQGGQPGSPGAPAEPVQGGVPSMNNAPQRIEDIEAEAERWAAELLNRAPEERRQMLAQLRSKNSLLADAAVQRMEKARNHRGTDAGQQEAAQGAA